MHVLNPLPFICLGCCSLCWLLWLKSATAITPFVASLICWGAEVLSASWPSLLSCLPLRGCYILFTVSLRPYGQLLLWATPSSPECPPGEFTVFLPQSRLNHLAGQWYHSDLCLTLAQDHPSFGVFLDLPVYSWRQLFLKGYFQFDGSREQRKWATEVVSFPSPPLPSSASLLS